MALQFTETTAWPSALIDNATFFSKVDKQVLQACRPSTSARCCSGVIQTFKSADAV
jgi:hypothetical protein